MAAERVVAQPSRNGFKGVQNIDIYKTNAKLLIIMTSRARSAYKPGAAFIKRENPSKQAWIAE